MKSLVFPPQKKTTHLLAVDLVDVSRNRHTALARRRLHHGVATAAVTFASCGSWEDEKLKSPKGPIFLGRSFHEIPSFFTTHRYQMIYFISLLKPVLNIPLTIWFIHGWFDHMEASTTLEPTLRGDVNIPPHRDQRAPSESFMLHFFQMKMYWWKPYGGYRFVWKIWYPMVWCFVVYRCL